MARVNVRKRNLQPVSEIATLGPPGSRDSRGSTFKKRSPHGFRKEEATDHKMRIWVEVYTAIWLG